MWLSVLTMSPISRPYARRASEPRSTTLPSSSWPMVRTSFLSRSSDLKIISLKALRNQMPRSLPQKPVMIGSMRTLARSR
jgi:hypothetical protein